MGGGKAGRGGAGLNHSTEGTTATLHGPTKQCARHWGRAGSSSQRCEDWKRTGEARCFAHQYNSSTSTIDNKKQRR